MAVITILIVSTTAPAQAASLSLAGSASPGTIKTGSATSVTYTLADMINGNVEVIVNNSGGNTVWSAYLPAQATGTHTVTWDGTAADGTRVPDGHYSITLATSNGTLGSAGTGNGQFINAFDVAVDGNGNIYVADTHNHRVQIFDSTGTWTKTLGTQESPEPVTTSFFIRTAWLSTATATSTWLTRITTGCRSSTAPAPGPKPSAPQEHPEQATTSSTCPRESR